MNWEYLREEMVRGQLISRGIDNKRVLGAMGKVERHKFVIKQMEEEAYEDKALPIGEGGTISQPYTVALMVQLLADKLGRDSRILDVGSGSGYQSAVLAEVFGEVVGVEKEKRLVERSRRVLKDLGYEKRVRIIKGDIYKVLVEEKAYEGIVVAARGDKVPVKLRKGLKKNGVLVMPVGEEMIRLIKKERGFERESFGRFLFVPLIEG